MDETLRIDPKPIIIIEGIFAFHDSRIRDLINCKVFVDTPADIRILRRAKRDINKRDRSIESIFSQYINTVKPMHEKFIEPTINYADIIVKDGGKNAMAIEIINNNLIPMIETKINGLIEDSHLVPEDCYDITSNSSINYKVFPNPFTSLINISSIYSLTPFSSFEIFHTNGHLIYSGKILIIDTNTIQINLTNLRCGIYILKIKVINFII